MKQQRTHSFSLRKQHSLLSEMVRTDFKLRYQASILGYIWSVLKPLFLFLILYTVFDRFLSIGKDTPNYAISLLLGIVLWSFFAEATSGALRSVVGKGGLIRKIYIPRFIIPSASITAALINLGLNLLVVFVFVILSEQHALSWMTIIALPLLLLQLLVFSVGVGFFLAAAYVKLRDIDYIWEVLRQALFYGIPIIYPLTRISSEAVQMVLMINPLTHIIQEARFFVTYNGPETLRISDVYSNNLAALIPVSITFAVCAFGVYFFLRNSDTFAEHV